MQSSNPKPPHAPRTRSARLSPTTRIKHPNHLLPQHKQKHQNSCIAWGLELILKMHGQANLSDYPRQDGSDPCGYVFEAPCDQRHWWQILGQSALGVPRQGVGAGRREKRFLKALPPVLSTANRISCRRRKRRWRHKITLVALKSEGQLPSEDARTFQNHLAQNGTPYRYRGRLGGGWHAGGVGTGLARK